MNNKNLKPPALTPDLLKKIFTAASIRRWNDQPTPIEFTELDKQAHKITLAYLLGRIWESKNPSSKINWEILIEIFIFEFFRRLVLTDIKPPIFYKLNETHKDELANFVLSQLEGHLKNLAIANNEPTFFDKFKAHLKEPKDCIELEIIKASHFYISEWEFNIIYNFIPKFTGIEQIKSEINKNIEDLGKINALKTNEEKLICPLIDMFGVLRFQKRWSQTPRVPQTSVLGHTLIVALSAYFISFDLGCSKQMRLNHFLCGLFHDLPEILTRDIISPIKNGIESLKIALKDIEKNEVEAKILSLVPENIQEDIRYFTEDEFSNRYKKDGQIFKNITKQNLFSNFNEDIYSPIAGEFLKICDHLSAFYEAKISMTHGIKSEDLESGAKQLLEKHKNENINAIDLGSLFRNFDIYNHIGSSKSDKFTKSTKIEFEVKEAGRKTTYKQRSVIEKDLSKRSDRSKTKSRRDFGENQKNREKYAERENKENIDHRYSRKFSGSRTNFSSKGQKEKDFRDFKSFKSDRPNRPTNPARQADLAGTPQKMRKADFNNPHNPKKE